MALAGLGSGLAWLWLGSGLAVDGLGSGWVGLWLGLVLKNLLRKC